MVTIHDFYSGKKIREATKEEYDLYRKKISKSSKEGLLSDEVPGKPFGIKGLIYMQDEQMRGSTIKSEITYFLEPGYKNTDETLLLARDRAIERGIKTVTMASIRGRSAERALEIFKDTDIQLIMCTCNACQGCERFSKVIWEKIENAGHMVAYTQEDEIPFPPGAALSYRRICQGMKVCVQISMSLVDQGIIPEGQEIIAVAGTGGKSYGKGWGLDTAVIIEALSSDNFWKYEENMKEHKLHSRKIKEFICMPR